MKDKSTRATAGTQNRRGRRPHNASRREEFASLAELVQKLGAERKRVMINGQEIEMSWAERSFRLTVDRAIGGNRRDLALLLRLMMSYPHISGSYREKEVIFIRGCFANL